MAESAPGIKSVGHGLISWGVPVIAGVGGFFSGDVANVYGLVDEWTNGMLTPGGPSLPLNDRIDYNAAVAAGVYGVIAMVIGMVKSAIPAAPGMLGTIVNVVFRSAVFYSGGVALRLVARAIAPKKVTATGFLTVNVPGLTTK